VLSSFVASQVVIIGLASLPLDKWRSFRSSKVVPVALHKEELVGAAKS
jgi:hypothetical protein